MKVVHVITGLEDGGAEGVLFRLCENDSINEHVVVSLSKGGKYDRLLRNKGIEVYSLGMKPNLPSPFALVRLIVFLRKHSPDVVQTWMYHADFFGGIAARIAGIRDLVWGIRHSSLEPGVSKKSTVWLARFLALLSSRLPSRIVVCARAAIDVHAALGYSTVKMQVIANGYNLEDFAPRLEQARSLRTELGIDPGTNLIGAVGRYNPQKDHSNLLLALAQLKAEKVALRCLLVGTNLDLENRELVSQIERLGLEDTVTLLGRRTDVPIIMSALDVLVMASAFGEAFPNVVAESMACQTPCVVTDVGDAAFITAETGWVVPPRDPDALASAIHAALAERHGPGWRKRCISARERVMSEFSLEKMLEAYSTLWNEVKDLK